ncbi:alanine--glyoxylate aminotransferase family protein [Oligoflexaceae bacterium]|nr:alanine--glyoxylate aminotransferase family protein [Oligoflexaceae bacterium]
MNEFLTKATRRPQLLTPGPTPVPHSVRQVGLLDPIYHRSEEFASLFLECRKKLQALFQSDSMPLILTSSGTGALEAALVNFTDEGDKTFVVVGGKFGERWRDLSSAYKCETKILNVESGKYADPAIIEQELSNETDVKALFLQASETSTGVFHPLKNIISSARKAHPDVLIVVDAVSAICAHNIAMDEMGIDVLVSGSQKGFGVPPGLSFIAASPRAWKAFSKRSKFYFDLKKEKSGQDKGLSSWTPASTLVEQLNLSMTALCELGPEKLEKRHQRYSDAVRAALKENGFELFAKTSPSFALTSFSPKSGISASDVQKTMKSKYGFQIAGGQGELKGKILRFSHLGFVDDFSILQGIAALDWTCADLSKEHHVGALTQSLMQNLQSDKNL